MNALRVKWQNYDREKNIESTHEQMNTWKMMHIETTQNTNIYIIKSTPFNLYRTTIRKIILNYETFHAVISTLSFFHSRFVFFFFCSFVVVAKLKRNKINIFTSWTQLETEFTIFILNKERILLRTFFFLWVDQKRKFIL